MKRGVVTLVGLSLVLHAITAWGAPPEKHSREPSADTATPPDLVILKSGGILRGTISELDPNGRVVIVLVTGDVRTIEMDQVEYAGPASKAPEPGSKKDRERTVTEIEEALLEGDYEEEDQEGGTSERGKTGRASIDTSTAAEVRFVSEKPGLKVHVHVGSSEVTVHLRSVTVESYETLCVTPCTVHLRPGSYRFGISKDGADPTGADDFVEVVNGSTVEVEHRSHAGTRAAGWLTMIGGALAGGAMLIMASNKCDVADENCESYDTALAGAGIVILSVGAVIGYVLINKKDEAGAHVALEAGAMPALARRAAPLGVVAGSPRANGPDLLPGLALTGRF